MTTYHASYNGQNGPTFKIEAKTERSAKKRASELGTYGQDIDLIELDKTGDPICCVASKKYGKKWVAENC